MVNETNEIIDTLYKKENPINSDHNSKQIIRKSPKAKYQIFDESEFTRGREVLGDLIVHGMIASGGTDIDWLIEAASARIKEIGTKRNTALLEN